MSGEPDDNVVDLSAWWAADANNRLKSGGGGGTFDGMEARVSVLEAHVGRIRTDLAEIKSETREIRREARGDFRLTWGALIAGFLAMAGLMARGFGWV